VSVRRSSRSIGVARLLEGLATVPERLDVVVTGLSLDSRQTRPGDLFLACVGTRDHGLQYLDQVRAKGARLVLWEPPAPAGVDTSAADLLALPALGAHAGLIAARFYGHPSAALRVVGVTGTDGKTSCAHFLAQCLNRDDRRCGVLGTVGQGLYGALEDSTHTTPNPLELQALLASMLVQGARDVVMEVSSHALDQGRVAGTLIRYALLTNLSRDHLDYHHSAEHYAAAKAKLFGLAGLEAAVLNADDAFGRELLAGLRLPTVVAYGFTTTAGSSGRAQVRGSDLRLSVDGFSLQVCSPWGTFSLDTRLLGRFNASNVLAVLAMLLTMGETPAQCIDHLSRLQPVPGRMERHGGGNLPMVVVDYAHTPNSLDHVLAALREHTRGRLHCVFGCGGDRDAGKRPAMARIAERRSDRVIVTDDNPRTEDPDRIVAQIFDGFEEPATVAVERDRRRAIGLAIAGARPADTVLIAGKGHEQYQLVGHSSHPFSDRDVVLDALGLAA
jgi:UDP-N-acetylmuramoyl-L-alanyl-D-glutamate--2,6-diaminopimelate ligase